MTNTEIIEKEEDIDKKLNYLISIYEDNRREIEQRIQQRDTFAIQCIVSSGAVLTISFLSFQYAYFLIALWPLVTIFFTIQIKYSYVIHNRIHSFLVNNLEPEISRLLNFSKDEQNNLCWETYCNYVSYYDKAKTPGIRETFFDLSSVIVPFLTLAIFLLFHFTKNEVKDIVFWLVFSGSIVFTVLILVFVIVSLIRFKKIKVSEKLKDIK